MLKDLIDKRLIKELSQHGQVDEWKKRITHELKLIGNKESDKVGILRRHLRSEETAEWIAAGVIIGESIKDKKTPQEFRDKLKELVIKGLQQKGNIHYLRHIFVPFAIASKSFIEPINTHASQKGKIKVEKAYNFFLNLFRYFEIYYLEKDLDSYFPEDKANQLLLHDILKDLDIREEEFLGFLKINKVSLKKKINRMQKILEKQSNKEKLEEEIRKLSDNVSYIDDILNGKRAFNRQEINLLKRLVSEFLKYLLKKLPTEEPKNFREWIISSIVISIPYLYEDFGVDWDKTINGIILYGLNESKNRVREFVKNIPFALSHKELLETVSLKEINQNHKKLIESFSIFPSDLYEFFFDLAFLSQKSELNLEPLEILSIILSKKYLEFALGQTSELPVFHEIEELVEGDFPMYSNRQIAELLFIAQLWTFATIHRKPNKYHKIIKVWRKLLEITLNKNDDFLSQNVIRVVKRLFYLRLVKLSESRSVNGSKKVVNYQLDILYQLWVIVEVADKWGLNSLVMKDLGAMLGRLLDFEYLHIFPQKDGSYPVILNLVLSVHPEVGVLEETAKYLASNEDLIVLLRVVEEKDFNVEEVLAQIDKIYNVSVQKDCAEVLLKHDFGQNCSKYIKYFIRWKFILSQMNTIGDALLSSKDVWEYMEKQSEVYSKKFMEKLDKTLASVKRAYDALKNSELNIGILENLIESEMLLIDEIETNLFPYFEGTYLRKEILKTVGENKKLLRYLRESNEEEIAKFYKKLREQLNASSENRIQNNVESISNIEDTGLFIPFLERWFLGNYLLDFLAKQKLVYQNDYFKKFTLRIYRWLINPLITISSITLLYMLLIVNNQIGTFIFSLFVSLIFITVPIFILAILLIILKKIFKGGSKNVTKGGDVHLKGATPNGLSLTQLFIPRLFTLLIIVSGAHLYADETWDLLMRNFSAYYLLSLITLLAITYIFVKITVDRKVGIELAGEPVIKRALNFLSLGLAEAFIITTFSAVSISKIMVNRVNASTQYKLFGVSSYLVIKASLLGFLRDCGLKFLPAQFTLTPWLILSITVQSLFTAMVLQILLENRELVE